MDVHLVRKMVPYEAPKKVLNPFHGSGQRLGAIDVATNASTSNVEIVDLEPQSLPSDNGKIMFLNKKIILKIQALL